MNPASTSAASSACGWKTTCISWRTARNCLRRRVCRWKSLFGRAEGAADLVISVQMKSYIAIALLTLAPVFAIKPPREAAPNFRAKTMDGEKFSNESLKGKVVLLQFWATWCGVGRGDQPAVDQLTPEFADPGVGVLAVNRHKSQKNVQRY